MAGFALAVWQRVDRVARMPNLRRGLAGQLCTFAAMVVPILLRRADQVLVLVYATSITGVLVYAALLAYPNIYPVIRGPRTARVATRLTGGCLLTVAAALLPASFAEESLGLPRGLFAVTAALLVGQGSYLMAVTGLIRAGDINRIGTGRLVYGLSLLLLTLVASLAPLGDLTLTLGNAMASGVGALVMSARSAGAPGTARRHEMRLVRAYALRAVRPTLSMVVGGWSAFLPALALPGLGSVAAPWAIITRICGGFSTVLVTILAPPFSARLSRAVRDRDPEAYVRARRTAVSLGAAVGGVAVPVGLGLAVYNTGVGPAREWFVPVFAAALLFWGANLVSITLSQLPNFLGRDTARLLWDVARAALMTGAFLATSGVWRLVAMGGAVTLATLWLLPLTRYRTDGHSAAEPVTGAVVAEVAP